MGARDEALIKRIRRYILLGYSNERIGELFMVSAGEIAWQRSEMSLGY